MIVGSGEEFAEAFGIGGNGPALKPLSGCCVDDGCGVAVFVRVYSDDDLDAVRERAVRMVFDHASEYDSQWAAIRSVAGKIGCSAETLRNWVRQAERDEGRRPGPTSAELEELRVLRREVKELRRANEILQRASAFFGAVLDRQHK